MPDLRRLLAPRSIAVVGGAPAERVIRQCQKLGFPGPIWPVHPTRSDIAGVPCFPSLDALPGVPDSVFLGVNRHVTVQSMRTLAQMGAGGAVCYGSGFAESGDGNLQDELIDAAGGVPFLGPNCYGFVNTFDRVALWPDEHGCGQFQRGAAIISQSGNVAVNLTFQQRGLRLGGDGQRRQPGQCRHGGLHRCVLGRLADLVHRPVPRGGARSAAVRCWSLVAPPSRVCRSWRCRPVDRRPARRSRHRTPGRCRDALPRTTRCSRATAWRR